MLVQSALFLTTDLNHNESSQTKTTSWLSGLRVGGADSYTETQLELVRLEKKEGEKYKKHKDKIYAMS